MATDLAAISIALSYGVIEIINIVQSCSWAINTAKGKKMGSNVKSLLVNFLEANSELTQVITTFKEAIDPITVSVTPDWPTVIVTGVIGIGSIITSISVARISKQNQMAQNSSKIAELRHSWITRFQEEGANYTSLLYNLHNMKYRYLLDPLNGHRFQLFLNEKEVQKILQKMDKSRSIIYQMSDLKKNDNINLNKLFTKVELVFPQPICDSELVKIGDEIEQLLNKISSEVWIRIKKDINAGKQNKTEKTVLLRTKNCE